MPCLSLLVNRFSVPSSPGLVCSHTNGQMSVSQVSERTTDPTGESYLSGPSSIGGLRLDSVRVLRLWDGQSTQIVSMDSPPPPESSLIGGSFVWAGPACVPTCAPLRMLRTLVWGLLPPRPDGGSGDSSASSTTFMIFPRASFPRVSMTEANCT